MRATRAQPAPSEPTRARPRPNGRPARGARGLVFALSLALPFGAASYAGQVLAPRLADAAGQRTARALARLSPALPPAPELALDPSEPLSEEATVFAVMRVAPGASATIDRKLSKKKPRVRGLLVRAAVVVRAIQAGGRPTGSPVAATGARPAGLVLHGISRYGSALRDGDVLTSISGAKATSSSAVVGAVIGAIKARSRAITGVIWRGQERLTVTVELPLS